MDVYNTVAILLTGTKTSGCANLPNCKHPTDGDSTEILRKGEPGKSCDSPARMRGEIMRLPECVLVKYVKGGGRTLSISGPISSGSRVFRGERVRKHTFDNNKKELTHVAKAREAREVSLGWKQKGRVRDSSGRRGDQSDSLKHDAARCGGAGTKQNTDARCPKT